MPTIRPDRVVGPDDPIVYTGTAVGRRISTTRPSTFDPRSLGSLALWLDARYPAGFAAAPPADGTALGTWVDLSGNGRDATQGTPANKPLFRSANPNLLTYNQATVETDTTGLTNKTNCTIARGTTNAAHGTASLDVTSAAAGVVEAGTLTGTSGRAVSPSTQYTAVVSARSAVITSTAVCRVYWWQSNGSASGVRASDDSSAVALATGSYTQYAVTATSPSDAAYATVCIRWTAAAASEVVRADQLGLWGGSSTTWVPPVTLPAGMPVVQFDGAPASNQDYMTATVSLPASQRTVYVVTQKDANRVAEYPFAMTGSGNVLEGVIYSGTSINANQRDSASAVQSTTAGGAPTGNVYVISAAYGSNSTQTWVNGASTGAAVTSPTVISPPEAIASFWLGSRDGNGSGLYCGTVAAILVFQAAHDNATRQRIERALGRIYGVAVA